jgi:hypothetical protein
VACAAGATSATLSSSSNPCSTLLAGYHYTGAGAISDDTVLQCPEDSYCIGTGAAPPGGGTALGSIALGTPVGLASCPTGSGTVGVWSATSCDSINNCLNIKPGYYFPGSASCTNGIQASGTSCAFKVCNDPNTNAFCDGATDLTVALITTAADTGRRLCSDEWTAPGTTTRTHCDVMTGRAGLDCTAAADCISPPS